MCYDLMQLFFQNLTANAVLSLINLLLIGSITVILVLISYNQYNKITGNPHFYSHLVTEHLTW